MRIENFMRVVSLLETAVMLKQGDIGIIPTDTLYGLVASALDREAVERVYRVRGRDEGKPCIVLVGDVANLDVFLGKSGKSFSEKFPLSDRRRLQSLGIFGETFSLLERYWPGKVSVIFPCPGEKWEHLHRGTGTIAGQA